VPHDRYDLVAKLHGLGHVRKQDSVDEGTRLSGRFPKKFSALYRPFVIVPPAAKSPKKKARVKKV
jgi:GTP-binding protein HflX